MIYVINRLKSSQKKFTIDPLFTIDRFTIARFDCNSIKHDENIVGTVVLKDVEFNSTLCLLNPKKSQKCINPSKSHVELLEFDSSVTRIC